MRVKRVALEHHRDVASGRRYTADGPASNPDFSAGGSVKTSKESEQGAFAATRGADQHQEFTILDCQIQLTNHFNGIPTAACWVGLAEVFETDAGKRQNCIG